MLRARVLKFNHGRYRATQRLSEQSSAQSGPRKVLGGYGRVFLTCAWVNVGTNSTFIYTVLFDGIETWLGSLLAATFALPDPTLFDILDSPTPGTSLAAALTATAITAVLLAPVDIYRITYPTLSIIQFVSCLSSSSISFFSQDLNSWIFILYLDYS